MNKEKNELLILITDEDKTGFEINKMSNFIDKYVSTSLSNLANDSITVFPDLDKQTLNIIGNVVSGAVMSPIMSLIMSPII